MTISEFYEWMQRHPDQFESEHVRAFGEWAKGLDESLELSAPELSSTESPLHFATRAGYLDIVVGLLDGGADANQCDRRDQLPIFNVFFIPGNLIGTAQFTPFCDIKKAVFKALLEKMAENTVQHPDESGMTLVHKMSYGFGFDSLLPWLLEKRREETVNALKVEDKRGNLPIDIAKDNSRNALIRTMLEVPGMQALMDRDRDALPVSITNWRG